CVVNAVNAKRESHAREIVFVAESAGEVVISSAAAHAAHGDTADLHFENTTGVVTQSARQRQIKLHVLQRIACSTCDFKSATYVFDSLSPRAAVGKFAFEKLEFLGIGTPGVEDLKKRVETFVGKAFTGKFLSYFLFADFLELVDGNKKASFVRARAGDFRKATENAAVIYLDGIVSNVESAE